MLKLVCVNKNIILSQKWLSQENLKRINLGEKQ